MVGVVITLAVLGGLVFWAGANRTSGEKKVSWLRSRSRLPIAAPAALALLGWRERPWLLVAAGLSLVPMTMLSFSYVFVLLLIPACTFFGVAIGRPRLPVHARAQPLAAFAVRGLRARRRREPARGRRGAHGHLRVGRSNDVGCRLDRHLDVDGEVMTARSALTTIAFLVAAIAIGALAPKDRVARDA